VEERIASRLAAFAGQKMVFGIRPEHISLGDAPAQGSMEAVVEMIEPMGAETYLHLTSGGHSFVARIPGDRPVKVRQTLSLVLDMSKGHFFDLATEKAIAV
jgi:multiple sugar transport system ATP-binding protein